MKVKDLLEQLIRLDPEYEVVTDAPIDHDYDQVVQLELVEVERTRWGQFISMEPHGGTYYKDSTRVTVVRLF